MDEFIINFKIDNYSNIFIMMLNLKRNFTFRKKHDAGHIGMSTHGRKGLSHFFNEVL